MSFPKKFEMIKKIIEDIGGKVYDGFIPDGKRFAEIRNKFAHSLYPVVEEDFHPEFVKERIKAQQQNWEKMHSEAKALYRKLIKEIDSQLYTEEPTRMKKYKTFYQRQTLDLIRHYEKLLVEEEPKKKYKSKKQ
jgi:hypothetical protein